ncbi:MAG: YHS domain-containing protein [Caulobacteraceae bacterium]
MDFIRENWWYLLLLIGFGYMMLKGGGCCGGGHAHGGHNHAGHNGGNGSCCGTNQGNNQVDMVLDPVCGMYVNPETAIKQNIDGKTYYFCSENCRKTFLERYQ